MLNFQTNSRIKGHTYDRKSIHQGKFQCESNNHYQAHNNQ